MSLESSSLGLASAVGTDIKNLISTVGNLTTLTTTDKSNLVAAINELQNNFQIIAELQAYNNNLIDDTASTGVVDKVWSVNKIIQALNQAKNDLLNGAPETFDTLKEISDYLASNDQQINDVLINLVGTVRYDVVQTLLSTEQQQACINIGIGSNDISIAEIYISARESNSSTNSYIESGYIEPGYFE